MARSGCDSRRDERLVRANDGELTLKLKVTCPFRLFETPPTNLMYTAAG
jgi:hypothetical protein